MTSGYTAREMRLIAERDAALARAEAAEQAIVDRYLVVVDHVFAFHATPEERKRAMQALNVEHTGRTAVPYDSKATPQHADSHYRCAATHELTIVMGLLPDGRWEVASPMMVEAPVVKNERSAR